MRVSCRLSNNAPYSSVWRKVCFSCRMPSKNWNVTCSLLKIRWLQQGSSRHGLYDGYLQVLQWMINSIPTRISEIGNPFTMINVMNQSGSYCRPIRQSTGVAMSGNIFEAAILSSTLHHQPMDCVHCAGPSMTTLKHWPLQRLKDPPAKRFPESISQNRRDEPPP